jgi:hypothetical protein
MQPLPPAGWYPDPNGSADQRWWNGQSWTSDMSPAPAPVASAAVPVATGFATQPYATQPYAPQAHTSQPYAQSYAAATTAPSTRGNRYAFITFGIVALYILIAVMSHVVVLGILPLGMSLRSKQAREPLAPLAIVAAIVSIVVAVAALSGH